MDEKKKFLTSKTVPIIAAILWLLGVYVGYILNQLVFSNSDAVTGVTIVWALIWLIGLILWAAETIE
ncbi:MAG: hypothetical protein JETCAE03_32020 [Ignavibacteriaceae bacterium]|jgi:xanthosine utilization system XapX-like protein|nr:MAG: hypothetical protein JETCAE03_32020 [Ignavibacteriaceae bacterium]